jgi:phosphatidate cytidylyltransferase
MVRVLSAVVLVAGVILTIWLLPVWATAAVAVSAAAAAGAELAGLVTRAGARVSPVVFSLAAVVVTLMFVAIARGWAGSDATGVAAALLVLVVAGGIAILAVCPPSPAVLSHPVAVGLAPMYVGLPLGAIVWVQGSAGALATTWLLATIALSDSAQYYCGRLVGRTKLSPTISPSKTVEGAIGGLVAATVAGVFLGGWSLPGLRSELGAVVGLMLAAFGIAGDLFESLLKRSAGAKDSSTLIPGHGGVLDRIDSYLFAAPVFYVFLRYIR